MADLEPTYHNMLKDLQESQKSDHDGREKSREADHFINKRDGQWEPEVVQMYAGKPRYTIDLTSGIVNDAHGEMNTMDFDIKVKPAGGPATNQLANHYDGLLRNIENNSGTGAKYIYRAAGKQMLTGGVGGWGIKQGYRDPKSFDQDLIIYPISNFSDRVWFDQGAELQDASDAYFGWKLTSMSLKNYERDFPKGNRMSVGRDVWDNVYSYKNDNAVIVGEYFWKKPKRVTLVRMTDGAVYIDDEKFQKVKDELAEQRITVDRERETTAYTVYQRTFDGSDFLTDAEKTVFDYIPLVPIYGNFEVSEDKIIYYGLVEKQMDPQRILNYSESRKVAEGSLAPRAKKWMTPEQASGHKDTLETMNTNNDPIQLYNHISDQPQPFETGGAQINPGLSETSRDMMGHMQSISGRLDPSGESTHGLQSGVALDVLVNKGDTGNVGYFTSMEIGIAHTCRICVGAVPKTYDAKREVQLDAQDGTTQTITINQPVYDEESGQVVNLNDLSKGSYSVVCSAGPAFSNKQEETVTAIETVARIDPSIMQLGGDVYLSNMSAPGMDKVAKRKRAMMVAQGLIPEDELTDDEKQTVEAAKNQPPGPQEQAMLEMAAAEKEKAEAMTQDIMSKMEERENKIMLEMNKLTLQNKKIEQEMQLKGNDQIIKAQESIDNQIKTMADTLKIIREAIGAEAIVNPTTVKAFDKQSEKTLGAIVTSK